MGGQGHNLARTEGQTILCSPPRGLDAVFFFFLVSVAGHSLDQWIGQNVVLNVVVLIVRLS